MYILNEIKFSFLKIKKYTFLSVYLHECMQATACMWKSEDNLLDSVLF